MWKILFTKNADKDKKLVKQSGLEEKAKKILGVLQENPYKNPPSYEKLLGDLSGYYSRRLNVQHRIVYRVDESNTTIIIHAMWIRYEK